MAIVYRENQDAHRQAPSTTAPAAPMALSTAWWPRCIDELGLQDKAIGIAPGGLRGVCL